MSLYQGRALVSRHPRRKVRSGALKRTLRLLGAMAVAAGLTQLPWERLADRFWVLTAVDVEGQHYLDREKVLEIAGIVPGQHLDSLEVRAASQALMLHPRIEHARVARRWLRGVKVRITERKPVLLVRHGQPWEMDSTGTLLAPLAKGVVADAPLLAGVDFSGLPEGASVQSPKVQRGLAWSRALDDHAIQLVGEVSEIDVSDGHQTTLLLLDGTRVLTPAWPPGTRALSALRVVLSDLKERGTPAREVDMRFDDQVIVRPADPPEAAREGGTETRRVDGDHHESGRTAV